MWAKKGVNEITFGNKFTLRASVVYFLNILNNNFLNCSYDLININGQIVKSNLQIQNQGEKIDLTDLESGLYLLRLKNNNSYSIKKFIKE